MLKYNSGIAFFEDCMCNVQCRHIWFITSHLCDLAVALRTRITWHLANGQHPLYVLLIHMHVFYSRNMLQGFFKMLRNYLKEPINHYFYVCIIITPSIASVFSFTIKHRQYNRHHYYVLLESCHTKFYHYTSHSPFICFSHYMRLTLYIPHASTHWFPQMPRCRIILPTRRPTVGKPFGKPVGELVSVAPTYLPLLTNHTKSRQWRSERERHSPITGGGGGGGSEVVGVDPR